eukprot:4791264-Amphidinium_carterae.2
MDFNSGMARFGRCWRPQLITWAQLALQCQPSGQMLDKCSSKITTLLVKPRALQLHSLQKVPCTFFLPKQIGWLFHLRAMLRSWVHEYAGFFMAELEWATHTHKEECRPLVRVSI